VYGDSLAKRAHKSVDVMLFRADGPTTEKARCCAIEVCGKGNHKFTSRMKNEDFCREPNLRLGNKIPASRLKRSLYDPDLYPKYNALGDRKPVENSTHIMCDMVKFKKNYQHI